MHKWKTAAQPHTHTHTHIYIYIYMFEVWLFWLKIKNYYCTMLDPYDKWTKVSIMVYIGEYSISFQTFFV